MRFLIFYVIGTLLVSGTGPEEDKKEEDKILGEASNEEEDLLDSALFAGLVDGYTFTLDCVTMSKHEHDKEEPSKKELQKEHEEHVKEATMDASYMTKHRPLQSQPVEKKEAVLYTELNILLHYLNSRGQEWHLKEPKDLGFEESTENHMVFQSNRNDSAEIKIPENLFYTVGKMKKSIPVHKDGKKPILLTCLESFIVSRLGFLSMNKLIKSEDPVDDKLEYLKRWIQIAKKHYILYLPYIAITAPRCWDLLKGDDEQIKQDYSDNNHYKHLHGVCKKMIDKRNDDGTLQTYVMLDSELHPELMKITLKDKHLFPMLLQEKEGTLKTVHQHHQHEMDWDKFQSAGNLLLSELEQQILKKDMFLKPESWGIDLDEDKSKEAEMELIKLFVKSQKKLNAKVIQTVRSVAHQSLVKSKKSDNDLKKLMLKFAEKEQEAAKKEASLDKTLEKCMEEAIKQVEDDSSKYSSSNQSTIATQLKTFQHDSWMECLSSRILDKLVEICDKNKEYCLNLMDNLDKELNSVNPDSTASIAMENLRYAVTVALLKKEHITMDKVKEHVLKVSKQEIKDMSEPASPVPQGQETESTTGAETEAKEKTESPKETEEGSKQEEEGETGSSQLDITPYPNLEFDIISQN